jgi:hypothetical protein
LFPNFDIFYFHAKCFPISAVEKDKPKESYPHGLYDGVTVTPVHLAKRPDSRSENGMTGITGTSKKNTKKSLTLLILKLCH